LSTPSAEPPLLLGIETSTFALSVAIARGDSVLVERCSVVQAHGPDLLAEIERALSSAGMVLGDLDGFACGLGPGLFTGLRVGLATAKGFAYALGRPFLGVPSLEAMALRALPHSDGRLVAPLMDARRKEVYAAVFDGDLTRVLGERARTPETLAAELGELGRPVVACGHGALLYRDRLGVAVLADEDLLFPHAREVTRLAARRFDQAVRGPALAPVAPLYIRPSDAELNPKFREPPPGGKT
jgi:tRNA threonylcarbamoyladenosine biosynthesis protein TsaB